MYGQRIQKDTPITDRQRAALDYVTRFIVVTGDPPGATAIGRVLGIAPQSAMRLLRALREKGYLRMDCSATSTIELTGKE